MPAKEEEKKRWAESEQEKQKSVQNKTFLSFLFFTEAFLFFDSNIFFPHGQAC